MLPTLDRDGNDCCDREVVPGRDVSQRNKEAGQRPGKEDIMKVGDIVKKVCRYSGKKVRGSTAVITAVHSFKSAPKLDIVILNNHSSGRPQRLAHAYQRDYVVVRECA